MDSRAEIGAGAGGAGSPPPSPRAAILFREQGKRRWATCPNPTTRATCDSSATPIRAAAATAFRSWSIAASPMWRTRGRAASPSSTSATRKIPARRPSCRRRRTPGPSISRLTTTCCSSCMRSTFSPTCALPTRRPITRARSARRSAGRKRNTGRRAWLSTTSRGRTRRDRSASFRSTASARTASGMSAAATPMSRR